MNQTADGGGFIQNPIWKNKRDKDFANYNLWKKLIFLSHIYLSFIDTLFKVEKYLRNIFKKVFKNRLASTNVLSRKNLGMKLYSGI